MASKRRTAKRKSTKRRSAKRRSAKRKVSVSYQSIHPHSKRRKPKSPRKTITPTYSKSESVDDVKEMRLYFKKGTPAQRPTIIIELVDGRGKSHKRGFTPRKEISDSEIIQITRMVIHEEKFSWNIFRGWKLKRIVGKIPMVADIEFEKSD